MGAVDAQHPHPRDGVSDSTASNHVLKGREIGPVGTALRVTVGLGLLYLAGAIEGGSWDVNWFDPLVGFIALPGVMVALGLVARRYAHGPIHFTGVLGHAVNAAVIVLLVVIPCTGGGAALFYGTTMLIAAWRGQRGCESTVTSNLVLRRDDQVGCLIFLPADEAEARLTRNSRSKGAAAERGVDWSRTDHSSPTTSGSSSSPRRALVARSS
jgi:hypothetical protein